MKALSAALAAAMVAAAVVPASAQTFDLSTIKCKEYFAKPSSEAMLILMWLDGYYSEDDAPAIIDMTSLNARLRRLSAYCTENPDAGLVGAFEETGKKE